MAADDDLDEYIRRLRRQLVFDRALIYTFGGLAILLVIALAIVAIH